MRKLFALKEWYSLDEAAKRLAITLNEEVTVSDIIQLSVENQIHISWYLRHKYAQTISWGQMEIPIGFFEAVTNKSSLNQSPEEHRSYFDSLPTQTVFDWIGGPQVFRLDGPYVLDLKYCGALVQHLLTCKIGFGEEFVSLEGVFIFDADGKRLRLLERFDEKMIKDMTPSRVEADKYFPSGEFPDIKELGIQKVHLDEFEAKLNNPPKKEENDLNPKSRHTLLKIIAGISITAYGDDFFENPRSTTSQVKNDLELKGISIDDETLRKWLSEAGKHYNEHLKNNM